MVVSNQIKCIKMDPVTVTASYILITCNDSQCCSTRAELLEPRDNDCDKVIYGEGFTTTEFVFSQVCPQWMIFICHKSCIILKFFWQTHLPSYTVGSTEMCDTFCLSQMLMSLVPQCLQSFFMDGFSRHFRIFIKRFSDAAFQMFYTKPSGGRDGKHVSEGQIVLRDHVIRQQIRELCRKEQQ